MKKEKSEFSINGKPVKYEVVKGVEWFSLTDLAKNFGKGKPSGFIRNWLKNRDTLNYLDEYERTFNPDFNGDQMVTVKDEFGKNYVNPNVSEYVKRTNAKFLKAKEGRGGGTFASFDIAIQFCMWISSKFQIWFIRDYRKMKEAKQQSLLQYEEWKTQKSIDAAMQIIRFEEENLEVIKEKKKRLEK